MQLFIRMGTQWRVGMTGATGLDYGVLFRLIDLEDVPADERRQLLDDVQVLETAALERMREQA